LKIKIQIPWEEDELQGYFDMVIKTARVNDSGRMEIELGGIFKMDVVD